MKRHILAGVAFSLCAIMAQGGDVVWQIGEKDGKDKEFLLRYNAWEYGSAPHILKLPEMDLKNHVFTKVIKENKVYPQMHLPERIVPLYEASFMPPEELITGLKLVWNEQEAGFRKITWSFARATNPCKIPVRGIIGSASDGRKVSMSFAENSGPGELSFVFAVKPGENWVQLDDVTLAKHYNAIFDAITLEKVAADKPPKPELYLTLNAQDNIFALGEKAELTFETWNGGAKELSWTVKNVWGETVATNAVPTGETGWYEINAKAGAATDKIMYAVIRPAKPENIPNSRFGCHETASDGYRLFPENSFQTMVLDKGIRRASLAGVRWIRLHSISWALREPEKGKYLFDDLDAKLERTFKHKMNLLLTVGQTPLWTSTSTDTKLTCCGNYGYLYYPPKDWEAWGEFMKAVVRRYGDRISHYEIGNEPGYTSAFWTCGDAKAFGKYLKTAYDAVKSVNPDAVVYPGAPLDTDFIEEACAAVPGAAPYDVMSAHYLGNGRRGATKTDGFIALAAKHGKVRKLVNSEDMHWMGYGKTFGHDHGAAMLIKSHVRDFSLGVERVFTFAGFHDFSDAWSFFTVDHQPRAYYPAYRAMTRHLEATDYLGSLSLADYEAYLFVRGKTPVIVAWRKETYPTVLNTGGKNVEVFDMMDCGRKHSTKDGKLTLKLGPYPVFIEGGDLEFLKAQVDCISSLPIAMTLQPGKSKTIAWKEAKLTVSAPEDAEPGVYDYSFKVNIKGRELVYPIAAEVVTGGSANRLAAGDMEEATWPKGKWWMKRSDDCPDGELGFIDGAGWAHSRALGAKGSAMLGNHTQVKVRPGERYILSARIRGTGDIGAMASILDKDGKRLDGKKPGLNVCCARASSQWKRVSGEISCDYDGAEKLSLFFIANYGDTKAEKEIFIDDIILARVTDGAFESKVVNEGEFATDMKSAKPLFLENGSTARIAIDGETISLRFVVKDDCFTPMPSSAADKFMSYEYDSVQFAIDPFNDGRDRTQFSLFRDSAGQCILYKASNYSTAELPENITRRGIIRDAKSVFVATTEGWAMETRIPLREVYPLSGKEDAIGFEFVVNNGDGKTRTWQGWSGGIGDCKGPRHFGTLLRKK